MRRTKFAILAIAAVVTTVFLGGAGCALLDRDRSKAGIASSDRPFGGQRADKKLANLALEMLDPGRRGYNPDKGKSYLEYALKHGNVSAMDVPAPVLLELLKSERVAAERSRSLEAQLEIMKEIDMQREEERK